MEAIGQVCKEAGLPFHLDGARLWNALVAKGETPAQYGQLFNSISICFSKSLGCPVGSVLLGDKAFIRKARRIRKVFGGGMRQAGMLAAAGLYALEHHIDRLATDHSHAQALARCLQQRPFVKELLPVETNIIIFELHPGQSAPALVQQLREKDILAYAIAPNRVRLVVHLDITPAMIDHTITILESI
jgi:threonine aldolase